MNYQQAPKEAARLKESTCGEEHWAKHYINVLKAVTLEVIVAAFSFTCLVSFSSISFLFEMPVAKSLIASCI